MSSNFNKVTGHDGGDEAWLIARQLHAQGLQLSEAQKSASSFVSRMGEGWC